MLSDFASVFGVDRCGSGECEVVSLQEWRFNGRLMGVEGGFVPSDQFYLVICVCYDDSSWSEEFEVVDGVPGCQTGQSGARVVPGENDFSLLTTKIDVVLDAWPQTILEVIMQFNPEMDS